MAGKVFEDQDFLLYFLRGEVQESGRLTLVQGQQNFPGAEDSLSEEFTIPQSDLVFMGQYLRLPALGSILQPWHSNTKLWNDEPHESLYIKSVGIF
jgi:hypothetical protein